MSWILEHLQLVLIVGLGLAGWLKSRYDAQQAAEEHEEEEIMPPPLRRPPPMPQKVKAVPRDAVPAVPVQDLGELRRQQELADRLRVIRDARKERKPIAGMATASRSRLAPVRGAVAVTGMPLRARLHNSAEVRAAVVLREVLDRPVGLR